MQKRNLQRGVRGAHSLALLRPGVGGLAWLPWHSICLWLCWEFAHGRRSRCSVKVCPAALWLQPRADPGEQEHGSK